MIALRQEESMPVGVEQCITKTNSKYTKYHNFVAQQSVHQKGKSQLATVIRELGRLTVERQPQVVQAWLQAQPL